MSIELVDVVHNRDFLDIAGDIPDNTFDLIVMDVPYGVDFAKSKFYDDSKETVFSLHEEWLKESHRTLKDTCHCYIFIPTLEVDKWVSAVKKYFKFKNLLATSVYTTSRYLKDNYTFDLQLVIYCSKGKAKRLNRTHLIRTSQSWLKDKRNKNPKPYTYQYPSFIKEFRANVKPNAIIKVLHPNQKSEELCSFFIEVSSKEEELVADFFCGSGTTLSCAKKLNRHWFGTDTSPEFHEVSLNRIENTKVLKKYRLKTRPNITPTVQTTLEF